MKTRIYISLPITGYELEERKEHAEDARAYLHATNPNIETITPFEVCPDGGDYSNCMGRDVEALLNCDIAAFCPAYGESRGCRVEHFVATTYDKKTIILSPAAIAKGREIRKGGTL